MRNSSVRSATGRPVLRPLGRRRRSTGDRIAARRPPSFAGGKRRRRRRRPGDGGSRPQGADAACSAARDTEVAARRAIEAAAARLRADYRDWHGALRILAAPTAEELDESFAAWLQRREGEDPSGRRRSRPPRGRGRDYGPLERLRRGGPKRRNTSPCCAGRSTRFPRAAPASRPSFHPAGGARGKAGAPLWKLCDFREGVPEADRAGIEAALEASGILDAWVMPDGRILSTGYRGHVPLRDDLRLPFPVRHAGDWLIPAIDPGKPALPRFPRMRGGISVGSAAGGLRAHWIDANGSWRMGPLAGRWTKPDPQNTSVRASGRPRGAAAWRIPPMPTSAKACAPASRRNRRRWPTARVDRLRKALAPDNRPILQTGVALDASVRASPRLLLRTKPPRKRRE